MGGEGLAKENETALKCMNERRLGAGGASGLPLPGAEHQVVKLEGLVWDLQVSPGDSAPLCNL